MRKALKTPMGPLEAKYPDMDRNSRVVMVDDRFTIPVPNGDDVLYLRFYGSAYNDKRLGNYRVTLYPVNPSLTSTAGWSSLYSNKSPLGNWGAGRDLRTRLVFACIEVSSAIRTNTTGTHDRFQILSAVTDRYGDVSNKAQTFLKIPHAQNCQTVIPGDYPSGVFYFVPTYPNFAWPEAGGAQWGWRGEYLDQHPTAGSWAGCLALYAKNSMYPPTLGSSHWIVRIRQAVEIRTPTDTSLPLTGTLSYFMPEHAVWCRYMSMALDQGPLWATTQHDEPFKRLAALEVSTGSTEMSLN